MVGFRGTVESFHSKETVKLSLKNGDDEGTSIIPLHEIVNSIDDLRNGSRFYLNPLYFSGDAQTFALYALDFSKSFQVYYGRRIVPSGDSGATVTADFVLPKPESIEEFNQLSKENISEDWPKQHPRTRFLSAKEIEAQEDKDDTRPLVIISHGLGGGSHEPIIRALAHELYEQGLESVVLNSRGCSRSKLSTPELFNGLETNDLRNFVKLLHVSYPKRPLYAVGFSFGGTILSNYLGEEGPNSIIKAAAVLSNPWDMVDSSYRITTRFLSKKLFLQAMTQTLTRLVKSNRKVLSQSPKFDEAKVHAKYSSVAEFDQNFTAPFYGFQTAFQYYRAASSVNRLLRIQVPLLAINAYDDPVIGVDSIPTLEAQANPNVVLIKTDLGGHLSYLQTDNKSWGVKKVVQFLKTFDTLVDTTKTPISDYKPTISKYDGHILL